ncbi:MAG: haloalkane dehalogenase [Proteobacteria bacterium]|nr:MAG: haloalkane dehalogenase [Pseudomonadota bacterium]
MNIEQWREKKQTVEVNGSTMAYVEMGKGDPIIFQHGNPTSSYLWRNIMTQFADLGRCLAVDLIGMGDSDKLPNSGPERYTFTEHQQYLYGAWEALGVKDNVTFVIHDWGSALGFEWCRQHPNSVKAVAHMEGIVKRLEWAEWPEPATEIFRTFRSPAGEDVVLKKNIFIEGVLPSSIMRKLTDEEMDAYRAPFLNEGEDRRPTLTWPRQIPLGGEPVEVCETIDAYGAYMKEANMPKLFIAGDPGMIMNGSPGEFARSWKNTSEASVKGLHFLQEDSPDEIAAAIKDWLKRI